MILKTYKFLIVLYLLAFTAPNVPFSILRLKKEYLRNDTLRCSIKNSTKRSFTLRAKLQAYSEAHWVECTPNIGNGCQSCISDWEILPKQLLNVNYSLLRIKRKFFKN